NPKTSGGARFVYLAAWGYAHEQFNGDEEAIEEYIRKLLSNVPVFENSARAATTAFAQRELGDVLLAWENEGFLATEVFGEGSFEKVTPSMSIRAEPPVAILYGHAEKHGTLAVAEAYIRFLYEEEAQEIIAERHFRPSSPEVLERYRSKFPDVRMLSVEEVFGGWEEAQTKHFHENGSFDRIVT